MSKHTSKKDKKAKGHVVSKFTIPTKIAKEEVLDPVEYWDDWSDSRDGMRDLRDRSRLRPAFVPFVIAGDIVKDNKKLLIKERIRKIKKSHMRGTI
jgi:hypothetical protein